MILKNADLITNLGYIIYPNGKQLYKKNENLEILVTDLSHKSIFNFGLYTVYIILLIKDSNTDVILNEKVYKGFIMPSLMRIENYVIKFSTTQSGGT